ncbi:protein kinase [Romeria aff. gracilis LEGE 07310]|uniref:non-specific serine/threonine protein kinase n=1 Tax=Vasconcelosia minhoensis LEGE 07310 TaxID=915328 RepID=A0A8J7DBD4_9CYAN|nr:protein kinase [Romeria gracilis]MBE9076253.1 protein kinase [Romeria aff. gracilis LEGE 07310]
MIRLLAGHYQVQKPLGKGGFGETFLAQDLHLPTQPLCVVKQLKPQFREAAALVTARRLFDLEAQTLYQLGRHNQIPQLLAHFEENGEFYLVQEFIEGPSLHQVLQQRRYLGQPEAQLLLRDLLPVLTFIQQQQVIHRDIKPANIILRQGDGKPVLIDFGAVKQMSTRLADSGFTISIGSSGYMPAEQQAGQPRPSSDLYALGMTCLQALTGLTPQKLPRDRDTEEVDLSQLPNGLRLEENLAAVLARMVRYDYRDRYPDAAATLQALEISQASPMPGPDRLSVITESQRPGSSVTVAQTALGNSADPTVHMTTAAPDSLSSREYRNRQALLNKVRNYWIRGVLENSLLDQIQLVLGLEEHPQAVSTPWNIEVKIQDQPRTELPTHASVLSIFDQMGTGRTLLILGEPGAGKTTTLLQLARELVSRAEQNSYQLLPVVLNLSSWGSHQPYFGQWIVEELNAKYQVPKPVGRSWVEQQHLLLLLDGLDEVSLENREACVLALNQFQQQFATELVVCCRRRDYDGLSQRLQLQTALYLQALSPNQVQTYLEQLQFDLSGLQQWLTADTPMQTLARSPLMLNIMVLAYRDLTPSGIPATRSLEEQRRRLFDRYIAQMLERRGRDRYSRQQMLNGLRWLARQLTHSGQTIFLIERLQPQWLHRSGDRFLYRAVSSLLAGLGFGLSYGIFSQIGIGIAEVGWWGDLRPYWLDSLHMILIYSPLVGLAISLLPAQVRPIETLNWSWRQALPGTLLWLLIGTAIGLGGGLIVDIVEPALMGAPIRHTGESWTAWIAAHLLPFDGVNGGIAGTVFGLTNGLRGSEVETKIIPNQAIWRSVNSAVYFAIAGSFTGGIAGALLGRPFDTPIHISLINGLSVGLLSGFLGGGGLAALKHFVLRLLLYRRGQIPWNYSRFLEQATAHAFLQKVGGGYIFIHRLLLEHFAQLPKS